MHMLLVCFIFDKITYDVSQPFRKLQEMTFALNYFPFASKL